MFAHVLDSLYRYHAKILNSAEQRHVCAVVVGVDPWLDWNLPRIPEEVLDRLPSIFTIWYVIFINLAPSPLKKRQFHEKFVLFFGERLSPDNEWVPRI